MADEGKKLNEEEITQSELQSNPSNEKIEPEDNTEEAEDINKIKELLKEKEKEIEDLNNKIIRLQADFLNYKKRTENEKQESINYGIQVVISDILPIIDNFERALESANDKEDNFYKGIEMIRNQLYDVLDKYNIKEIKALGEKFDPNIHHAISTVETNDESGTVVEVYQKGYLMEDKVVRPSMVIVSK